jgi:hypothetical protein
VLLVAAALLVLAFSTYRRALGLTLRDRRMAALGLLPMVPLFLWGCMALSAANYLADVRYFWVLTPLGVLVAYSVAWVSAAWQRDGIGRLLRPIAALYVCGYVAMALVYVLFLPLPGGIGTMQRGKVLAGPFVRWPSMALTYEHSASRLYILSQMQADPQAVLVTGRGAAFNWDPAVDGARVRGLYCSRSEPRYVEGPVRLLIHTFDIGEADEVWRYFGNSTLGSTGRAECFERLPGRRLLRRFPDEGMKVIEATVAAGQRISLNEEE